MKNKVKSIFILASLCLLASCNTQNQPADQLIVGKWKVYKQTITGLYYNEQGNPVQGTREMPCSESDYFMFQENGTIYYSTHPNAFAYSLQQQNDGTWLLTVENLFDMPKPDYPGIIGWSPITVHKISHDRMEWEYVRYGGDEGPDTYYQYLKRN